MKWTFWDLPDGIKLRENQAENLSWNLVPRPISILCSPGLEQDCSNSIANTLELLQSCCKGRGIHKDYHINGLAQDCSNSFASALELMQSCPQPSICFLLEAPYLTEMPFTRKDFNYLCHVSIEKWLKMEYIFMFENEIYFSVYLPVTRCDLVTLYGGIDQGQHWLR